MFTDKTKRAKKPLAKPDAVAALDVARQGVAAAEQRLRDAEREGRDARQAVILAQDEQRNAVYTAAKAGSRADLSDLRAMLAAREQDAADMDVVVAAHTDAVAEARQSLRDAILEHAPVLLDLQAEHAAAAIQARGEMEQRHASERAEQASHEQGVRAEAQLVLDEMPRVFAHALPGDELVPRIRPDRASPDLAPFLGEPWMPDYLLRAIHESRELYSQQTTRPGMIAG